MADFLQHDPRLVISTVGFLLLALLNICVASFVLVQGYKKPLNILFFLMNISVVGFQISHAIGITIADPNLSRSVLMFNLFNIPLSIFIGHWIFVLIGKAREQWLPTVLAYIGGAFLLGFYIIYPDAFLLESVPKLYITNYYVPGSGQWIMRVFFNIVFPIYFLYQLFKAYRETNDLVQKNRYKYVFAGLAFGFTVGSTAILLVYNVPFDPLYATLFGLYPLPLAYAVVKYELMDIKIVAKNALLYASLAIIFLVLFLTERFLEDFLSAIYGETARWIALIFFSLIAIAIAVSIWKKFRQTDILKYEFITIITHKFLTPLTHIRFALENMTSSPTKEQVSAIRQSSQQLVRLVDTLVSMSDMEATAYQYHAARVSVNEFVEEVLKPYRQRAESRGMALTFSAAPGDASMFIDRSKLEFVLQVLIDNAFLYTPALKGSIAVSVRLVGKAILIQVKDTGIGISKETLPFIFKKFYRSKSAKQWSTEGLGLGLYMSTIIAERSGGTITVESEGEGKGSTFTLSIPRT